MCAERCHRRSNCENVSSVPNKVLFIYISFEWQKYLIKANSNLFQNQWVTYGGRCGVCGDPYQQNPREHELGGKYASGIITRVYPIGGLVDVVIGLTANHGGYFEFKLCPIYDPASPASEDCLNRHPLHIVNGGRSICWLK